MPHKQTVAVIGASRPLGAFIAKAIAVHYHVLLMDHGKPALELLKTEIESAFQDVETDVVSCCKDASWEADIIVVAVPADEQPIVAATMKEVATCKIIVNTATSERCGDLQKHLPYSRVVDVLINGFISGIPDNKAEVVVTGTDEEAVETALFMMNVAGFTVTRQTNMA